MGWVKSSYIILLMILSLSHAAATIYVEPGDNGKAFAENISVAQCAAANVQAVYVCTGNVVRVVSAIPGEGNVFYKPDGRVVKCPTLPPTQIGGECMQLLMPNYCPGESRCGNTTMPQVFPGQNDSAEQKANDTYYIVPGQAASDANNKSEIVAPEPQKPQKQKVTVSEVKNEIDMSAPKSNGNIDNALNYLVYAVLALGLGSVVVLFLMFRNSLSEESG